MNATYPKTPPILSLKRYDGFRDATLFKIQKFLETQPRMFAKVEQEMCDKIVEGIREIVEDAALAKAHGRTLPSLEEERERHEANLAKQAREQKEAEERKKEEESKEEERVMAAMLQSEIERQRKSAKESKVGRASDGFLPSRNSVADSETLDFDQLCTTKDKNGNTISFRSVTGKCDARQGTVSIVYVVRPMLSNGQGNYTMALKESVLRASSKDVKDFKKQLQNVEAKLQSLKDTTAFQHRHVVELLDFRVESIPAQGSSTTTSWKVSLLTPLADKGSLEELLELAGQLDIGKVRSWTRDLLDALSFLHNKNISHQDVHPGNVLLFRDAGGQIIPKLSDMSYQRELHNIAAQKRALPGITSAKSAYWLPPEIAPASRPQYTVKTDIWDFGIVFVQMIFGLDVLKKYSSPKNLMESLLLSHPLQELVSRFFKDDKNKRPRAFELGSSEFLATDAPILQEDSSTGGLSASASLSSLQALPSRPRRDSVTRSAMASSRYTEDFTEEGRLGKGGFGEVVKARKKLDGQIYAIKKITQRSQASLTEILKEVRLLSQLSHPAVVRYYNTWVEEVADVAGTDGETSTEATDDTREANGPSGDIQYHTSTGGLDFMSSNAIVFGYSDDEDDDEHAIDDDDLMSDDDDDDEEDDDDETEERTGSPIKERNLVLARRARFHRPYRTILYISMEYCEKRVSLISSYAAGVCIQADQGLRLFEISSTADFTKIPLKFGDSSVKS